MKKDNLYHNNSMWKGASNKTFSKARLLRNSMTEPEKMLWQRLSNNQLEGFKFRRQHPILFYIVDFYCHALQLVIEIDGGYHGTAEQMIKDEERTKHLEANNITVIRFTNEAVMNDIEKVIKEIVNTINNLKGSDMK
jgi:very-short-patch-repair endonuclease